MKKFKEFCSEHKREIIVGTIGAIAGVSLMYKSIDIIYTAGFYHACSEIRSTLISMDRKDLLEDVIETMDKCVAIKKGS